MTTHRPRIHAPSESELEQIAQTEGIGLREGEAAQLLPTVSALVEAAARAEERETITLHSRVTTRDPGQRPTVAEDPYNAVVRKCLVEGAGAGPLAGRTVGVKDNIAVGGVPMTEGSHFPPWTPSHDSVVVERVLEAGGSITATLNMDEFGGGATGVMSSAGPARNPVDPRHSAGGSSGGAGAAVRSDAVDLALAVDQGGSGRIPAAFCGVVAVKATHGLVPSYGVGHIDHTIDFVCPLARRVGDAAVLLEVIAGDDWRDPQWVRGAITTETYSDAEGLGVAGLRIGLIDESESGVECDVPVLAGVKRAVEALQDAGAVVERFSLPIWADGFATYQPLVAHLIANMMRSEGAGYGHLGYIDVDRSHAFALARRGQSLALNPYVKSWMLADRFLYQRFQNVSYGRLHNQRLLIRRRIAEAFQTWDLLLTPTVPNLAPPLFDHDPTFGELLNHSPASVAFNTAPLNLSGNPALSVPTDWGGAGDLPTAIQVIAPHFAETEAFRAAFVLERALGPFQ